MGDLQTAIEAGFDEVLIGHKSLSVLGALDSEECHAIAKSAQGSELRPVLVWDTLHADGGIDEAIEAINSLDLKNFAAVRVQEVGALEYLLGLEPKVNIQFIAKSGAHNLESLRGWCRHIGIQLERLIVSSELPKERLAQYIQGVPVPVEVLGFGPVLLFYSPRSLLSWSGQGEQTKRDFLSATVRSDESPQAAMRVIETRHGTLAFHAKDYSLLDKVEELKSLGLGAFQIDLRLEEDMQDLPHIAALIEKWNKSAHSDFVASYSRGLTRCFYTANSTDVLFKRLRNQLLRGGSVPALGRVVEAIKERHLIIEVLGHGKKLTQGQRVKFLTPNGKFLEYTLRGLKNIEGESVEEVPSGEFAIIPYISSITPVTAVYE